MTITKKILSRIAGCYSRERDEADPKALLVEIQLALDCSYGEALNHANDIRVAHARATRRVEHAV